MGEDGEGRRHQAELTLESVSRYRDEPTLVSSCLKPATCAWTCASLSACRQHTNASHPIGLLRARRERPRGRAAEERDEVAPVHSVSLVNADLLLQSFCDDVSHGRADRPAQLQDASNRQANDDERTNIQTAVNRPLRERLRSLILAGQPSRRSSGALLHLQLYANHCVTRGRGR